MQTITGKVYKGTLHSDITNTVSLLNPQHVYLLKTPILTYDMVFKYGMMEMLLLSPRVMTTTKWETIPPWEYHPGKYLQKRHSGSRRK